MSSPPGASAPLGLAGFNQATPDQLRDLLTECLPVARWIAAVTAGRPYHGANEAIAAGETVSPLHPAEITGAMASHARIGEKPTDTTTSANWSRSEQSGVDNSAATEFRAANVAYEQRFGHVFLVCASGKSGAELLANLRERMDNDPSTELAIAGEELIKIAALRLRKVLV